MAAGLAVVTNYVTAAVPDWANDPWVVWGVFGVLVLAALGLHLYGRRLDAAESGPTPGRPVPVGRIVAGAAAPLGPPALHQPVRGRDQVIAQLELLLDPAAFASRWRRWRTARTRSEDRIAVLAGAGGMGKTTVAAALAARARAAGVPVFWIRWQGEHDLAERMVQIAVAHGLPEQALEAARAGRMSLADTVWEHLGRTGRRCLIVVDNLDDPNTLTHGSGPVDEYRGWIRPWRAGLLAVTSRVTDPTVWGGSATVLRLGPLDEPDGGRILLDTALTAGSPTEARALAERLGGLPLALKAAARYLAAPGSRHRTFTAYRQALDTELDMLLGAEHPRASHPGVARTIVRHTWDLSLDQLTADGTTLARPVLCLLSLLAAAPVPLTYLTPELVTAASGHPASAPAVEDAVNGLHTYGLLDIATHPSGVPELGLVVLHPLVREITAHTLTAQPGGAARWHHAVADRTIQLIEEFTDVQTGDRATLQRLTVHTVAVIELPGNSENTPLLRRLATLVRFERGRDAYTQRLALGRRATEGLSRLLGPDHPDTLTSRSTYAAALADLRRYQEAAELHQQNLEAHLRVGGPDHPDTLTSRSRLALAFQGLGQYQEAADLHQQNLEALLRVGGPDHPDTLRSRNNVAHTFMELGRTPEAARLLQQILRTRVRVLGQDHPDTLATRTSLAIALLQLGQADEAVSLLNQVLDARLRALGPEDPQTLTSYDDLAFALERCGEYQSALDLLESTLETRIWVHGLDHPATLTCRNNLAAVLVQLGRAAEAVSILQQNVDDLVRLVGPDAPGTLTSRHNLATTLYQLGQIQEAAGLLQQLLDDRVRVLGPDSPDTLTTRHNLAVVLARLGQGEEAAELERQNRDFRLRATGPDHPDVLPSTGEGI
ncbi:FxSxx-COOH system tetratricopeptide repeat protein [Streptomyces sp. NPDC094032]|uniref:FxSxx-COOH system tetratricopeptide repeat protein n=1 Tax=Streptomyces sp. NPDC094032 TaxID=3155308 RepID=UPI00331F2789